MILLRYAHMGPSTKRPSPHPAVARAARLLGRRLHARRLLGLPIVPTLPGGGTAGGGVPYAASNGLALPTTLDVRLALGGEHSILQPTSSSS